MIATLRVIVAVAMALFFGGTALAFGQGEIYASPERMETRIKVLSQFGATPEGGVNRIAFSDADLAGRA